MLARIELDTFSNKEGMAMAMRVLELAEKKGLKIAIRVERLNYIFFQFIDEELGADKESWMRRKANVAKHFEESSLLVKEDLAKGGMSLSRTFLLEEKDYLAKGGAIPIFVKQAGMVGVITVSGLKDVEDHELIVEALGIEE